MLTTDMTDAHGPIVLALLVLIPMRPRPDPGRTAVAAVEKDVAEVTFLADSRRDLAGVRRPT